MLQELIKMAPSTVMGVMLQAIVVQVVIMSKL
jgi:hypothetical protein